MRKKWPIIVGVIVIIGVVLYLASIFFMGGNEQKAKGDTPAVDYGIEYFEVPDFDQVYINGVIQPDQMEAFSKEQQNTSEPDIKVENGAIVEEGTVLYTLEDKEVTKEIENQNNTVSKLYTKRENILSKWGTAESNFYNTAEEERTTTKAQIDEQYQSEIDTVDEEIYFANATVGDLAVKQFVAATAKFRGRVSIPEVKDENTPILRLTSEGLYMAGQVNEKDLAKISLEQRADITMISNGQTVTGKIAYIDDNPPEKNTQGQSDGSGTNGMSTYTVKLSLDNLDGIKNGYHAQGTINLTNNAPIEIPTKAIHEEDGLKYVLVNDFGSVIRRVVQTGEVIGENTQISSGLESADRIILSSEKEVKEGDLIEGDPSGDEANPAEPAA